MTLESGRWIPGIGDPSFMGWLTVVVYFIVAYLCFRASARSKPIIHLREELETNPRRFWIILGALLIALGINKQLDVQTLFTQIGRDVARQQGWYEYREMVQLIFIASMAGFGLASLFLLMRWLKHTSTMVKLASSGCVFLFIFVLIRASSFHHMDEFIGFTLGGARMNWVLELGSLIIIMVAAILTLQLKKRPL